MPGEPKHAGEAECRDVLAACGRGELAPNVALMRLIMACDNASDVEHALALAEAHGRHPARQRLKAARALWRQTPAAFATVKAVLRSAGAGGSNVTDWKRVFDDLAVLAPQAGMALYALGRADLLETATAEVVQSLEDRDLLVPGSQVLEIGCGIGRFLPALARQADVVVGLDIAPAMLRHAAENCPPNALLVQGSGLDLAPFADHTFDLVLAVDSFPYIVAAGAPAALTHLAEAARVLKPGGWLVIINYSYRGDDALDRREIAAAARENRLTVTVNGWRGFSHWDGLVFHLHKPA